MSRVSADKLCDNCISPFCSFFGCSIADSNQGSALPKNACNPASGSRQVRMALYGFIELVGDLKGDSLSPQNTKYFLRWKNIFWRWLMVSFEIRILRI